MVPRIRVEKFFLKESGGGFLKRGVVWNGGELEESSDIGPIAEEFFDAAVVGVGELLDDEDGEELVLGVGVLGTGEREHGITLTGVHPRFVEALEEWREEEAAEFAERKQPQTHDASGKRDGTSESESRPMSP